MYAALKQAAPALYHAQRCLDICQAHGIGDFDLAYAYEALARAHVVAGQKSECEKFLALARVAGEQIAEQADREHFEADLKTILTGGL